MATSLDSALLQLAAVAHEARKYFSSNSNACVNVRSYASNECGASRGTPEITDASDGDMDDSQFLDAGDVDYEAFYDEAEYDDVEYDDAEYDDAGYDDAGYDDAKTEGKRRSPRVSWAAAKGVTFEYYGE